MVDALLSADEAAFREHIAHVVATEIAPFADEIDRKDEFPRPVLETLNRYRGITFPTDYGGGGRPEMYACLLIEEVGAVCPALVTYLEAAQLAGHGMVLAGNEDQRRRYLGGLTQGQIGVYALTDEVAGSDPAAMRTTAHRTTAGYRIVGAKRHISFFDVADFVILFARTETGVSAFALEPPFDGIEKVRRSEWSGLRGHTAWDLRIDTEVPASALVGVEGQGLKVALRVLGTTRISLAAGHCGLARTALELATQFAREREVDGQPLWRNQSISFRIVEARTQVEAARLLTHRAARMNALGLSHRAETSQAKFAAAEALLNATVVCNRILGGLGGHLDTPAERYMRDAVSWVAAQGTIEVQKLTVARELFAS